MGDPANVKGLESELVCKRYGPWNAPKCTCPRIPPDFPEKPSTAPFSLDLARLRTVFSSAWCSGCRTYVSSLLDQEENGPRSGGNLQNPRIQSFQGNTRQIHNELRNCLPPRPCRCLRAIEWLGTSGGFQAIGVRLGVLVG